MEESGSGQFKLSTPYGLEMPSDVDLGITFDAESPLRECSLSC